MLPPGLEYVWILVPGMPFLPLSGPDERVRRQRDDGAIRRPHTRITARPPVRRSCPAWELESITLNGRNLLPALVVPRGEVCPCETCTCGGRSCNVLRTAAREYMVLLAHCCARRVLVSPPVSPRSGSVLTATTHHHQHSVIPPYSSEPCRPSIVRNITRLGFRTRVLGVAPPREFSGVLHSLPRLPGSLRTVTCRETRQKHTAGPADNG